MSDQFKSRQFKIVFHLVAALVCGVVVKLIWEYVDRRVSWWPHGNSGDLLAIIAIAFAIVQFLDARQEEQAMRKQEDVLGLRYLLKEYDEEMIRHLNGQGGPGSSIKKRQRFFCGYGTTPRLSSHLRT
jgi:hypothetical protein